MNRLRWLLVALSFACFVSPAMASASDPLAPRDWWGRLHQMPDPNDTDFERRETCRFFYYSKSRAVVAADPAYVGALQVALTRNGYYCGPIDGIFSDEVSDAIARLQKGYSMRVNGAITVAVRRALRLP
jgi:Putative peptidoglycan binding domain